MLTSFKSKQTQQKKIVATPFMMGWSNHFTPSDDGCKTSCLVQILSPRIRRGAFANIPLIVGMDPNHLDIRFVSLMRVPHRKLNSIVIEKALRESRGFKMRYQKSEQSSAPYARDLIMEIKELIHLNY